MLSIEAQGRGAAVASEAELRKFAWLMGGAFSVLGLAGLWRGRPTAAGLFIGAALLFLLAGLVRPPVLGPVHTVWMGLARILSWVNTRVILSLLFYLLVSPVALLMKLFGRDALERRIDRRRASYWRPRTETKPARERYEHLY